MYDCYVKNDVLLIFTGGRHNLDGQAIMHFPEAKEILYARSILNLG